MNEMNEDNRNFDLSSFKRATTNMIGTNENAYNTSSMDIWRSFRLRAHEYTPKEIQDIILSGSLLAQRRLSRDYYSRDGYYKRIITYYATLLKYVGLLIPNPAAGKSLSTSHISKRYYAAVDYLDSMQLQSFCVNCAQRALIDGCYFGARLQIDNKHFSVIDLPSGYCCSRFKDEYGNDLIEFDLSYFNTISDQVALKAALAAYPPFITKAYKNWKKNPSKNLNGSWIVLPADIGICFPLFDGKPMFLTVIPKTLEYDAAVDLEQERNAEEIQKIIIQKIPHLNDGRLVFEPDEANEMHTGAVGMMKNNKNVSVLTTYADVEVASSKTSNDDASDRLSKIEQNIYSEAGVSGQLFNPQGAGALSYTSKKDMALMMYFANKIANFVTNIINELYSNANISFKYNFLPVSYFNESDYLDESFKLVGSGYSILAPAVTLGFTQRDLCNLKDLENKLLKLSDKLKPLSTAYTQSSNESGRPTEKIENRSETTIETEQARTNTGGGSGLNE